jgi:hypothetical protein
VKAKTDYLETSSKIKNILGVERDISQFKKVHLPRTKIIWNEKDDLFTDSYSILATWKKNVSLSSLIYVHGVSDVRQTEIHTAGPLLPESSTFKVEMAIVKLKRHKSQELINYQQN